MKTILIATLLCASTLTAQEQHRLTPAFWAVNAANFGAAALDVESTQHCIHTGACKEGNFLMPSSRAGQYAETMGLAALNLAVSAHLKHKGERWWIGPVIGVSVHGFAAGWNLHF